MFVLALRNLWRRPLRSLLAVCGLTMASAVLTCLWGFGHGYERALGIELDRMGMQMMLVPLGCPYDAAARVLKGKTLENSLPDSVLVAAKRDPAVAVAAPLLLAAIPNLQAGRTDMWVGLDETALHLKPWWKAKVGSSWFSAEDSVILGCDAAEVEMRAPGDLFFSPETGQKLRVAGVLERSGTSDDSLFFVPLRTAQNMFQVTGLITLEALLLTGAGTLCGILLAFAAGPGIEGVVKEFIPLAPTESISQPTVRVLAVTMLLGVGVGVLSGFYPAWRAGRLQPAEALKTD